MFLLLNLRNKENSWPFEITALFLSISSEFHWINEINWTTKLGGEVLVNCCCRNSTSRAECAALQLLCLEFTRWPSLPGLRLWHAAMGGSLEKMFANEALAPFADMLGNWKVIDDSGLCLEISFRVCIRVCIYVVMILTHPSHFYDLLALSNWCRPSHPGQVSVCIMHSDYLHFSEVSAGFCYRCLFT